MRERVRRTKGLTVTDQVLEDRGSGTEGSQTSTLLSVLSSCPYYPLPSGPILAETLRSSVTRPISLFLMLPFPKLLWDHYRHPATTTPPSPRRSIYSTFNFLLDAFVPPPPTHLIHHLFHQFSHHPHLVLLSLVISMPLYRPHSSKMPSVPRSIYITRPIFFSFFPRFMFLSLRHAQSSTCSIVDVPSLSFRFSFITPLFSAAVQNRL